MEVPAEADLPDPLKDGPSDAKRNPQKTQAADFTTRRRASGRRIRTTGRIAALRGPEGRRTRQAELNQCHVMDQLSDPLFGLGVKHIDAPFLIAQ